MYSTIISKHTNRIAHLLVLLFIWGNLSIAQIASNIDYYIENKQSKNVFDVRGGSSSENAPIQHYIKNYTKSQIFKLTLVGSSTESNYYIKPSLSSLYLSCKFNPALSQAPATQSGNNYQIIQNSEYKYDSRSEFSPLYLKTTQQHWKLVPVPNESDTYYIQSVFFRENTVLEPASSIGIGPLKLAKFTGSENQKWRILPTLPKAPSSAQLIDFQWKSDAQKLVGKLKWSDNSNNEDGFQISMTRTDYPTPRVISNLNYDATQLSINENSSYGKNKKHCFYIKAKNKWGFSEGIEVCGIPNTIQEPPSQTLQGYSKLYFHNCHQYGKSIRIWSYDFTENTGIWTDHGLLIFQGSGNQCPVGYPIVVSLKDGHIYKIISIDCGNNNPQQTDGSCHKMITDVIGKATGNTGIITAR